MKVELHVHTHYSYDTATQFEELIQECKSRGINAVAIADHNEIEGALRFQKVAPFTVIVGEEINTAEGEIIGLFIKSYIPPGLSIKETIKKIKSQGGLVYLPHPFDHTTRKTAADVSVAEEYINDIDIVEIYNGRTVKNADNNKALQFAKLHKKAMAVGSDAHTKYEIGRNYQTIPVFDNAKQFLGALQKAKYKKSPVMYWPFLLTKFNRYIKRNKKITAIDSDLKCDICESKKVRVLYKKKGREGEKYLVSDDSYGVHPQIVQCIGCGMVFASPRSPEKKILHRYQEFEDDAYEQERNTRKVSQITVLKGLEHYAKKGKLLEVGSATGILLEAAQERGWKAVGIEPSTWAAQQASKHGLKVFNTTLDKTHFASGSFDAAVLVDVIEHVTSPSDVIAHLAKLIKTNGTICLVTPDWQSTLARVLGEKWWHVRPDHIFYFSPKTMTFLLEKNGFEVLAIRRYGWTFSYDYWASRFQKNIPMLYKVLVALKNIPILNIMTRANFTLNFRDSMQVYAKKI